MKRTTDKKGVVAEDYMALVRAFPLRPIRGKVEYKAAMAVYSRFAGREDLTSGENDYVNALTRFITDYEQRKVRSDFIWFARADEAQFMPDPRLITRYEEREVQLGHSKMSPLDVLKFLMEQHDMSTPTELGKIVGSRALASQILHGKRGLSKRVIQKLSAKFGVEAGIFLSDQ